MQNEREGSSPELSRLIAIIDIVITIVGDLIGTDEDAVLGGGVEVPGEAHREAVDGVEAPLGDVIRLARGEQGGDWPRVEGSVEKGAGAVGERGQAEGLQKEEQDARVLFSSDLVNKT